MLKAFLRFLGGEEGEDQQMWLLLGLGFCMGVFIATYQVGSESLFLQTLGEEYLGRAFFTTGFLGIIITGLYVRFQTRVNFSTLAISTSFLVFIFVGGCRFAFYYIDYENYVGFAYLPFTLFVMMGPITALSLLTFWGLFGRLFDTRQAKRIIGGIDTGQLTATMIAFFSIPLITRYLPFIDTTYDLLFVSGFAAFGMLYFVIWISIYWNINKSTRRTKEDETKLEKVTYWSIFKDPYTRLLSIFLLFSVGAAVFVDYTFLSTVERMYTDQETGIVKEQNLNDFLSFFSGTIMIMSFLIQSFINDVIIGRFGLKIALMTMPIILILFTLGGIIVGHVFGFEYDSPMFLLFFLFTVSAKAFTDSLRDALEGPAFKLFFLPFHIKIRVDIQSRIEGVVLQISKLFSGGIQLFLGLFGLLLIYYSYIVVAVAGMVMWLAYKLYNQYKVTLKKTLERQRDELLDEGKRNENNTINILKSEVNIREEDRVLNGLRLLEKIDPFEFEYALLDRLSSKYPKVRRFAYMKLNQYECFDALDIITRELKTEGNDEVLVEGKKAVKSLRASYEFELNDETLRQLVRSPDKYDRIQAARVLSKLTEDRHIPFVVELLRDINPEVRTAAIETAGKLRRPEFWQILVENLHLSTYGNAAAAALVHSGDAVFHTIDTAFYRTGQYKSTMLRVIQIFGRIGGRQAIDMLWKKIDYPDKQIVTEILLSLSYIGFEAFDFQASRIQLIIESLIGDIAWNIKVLQDIPDEEEFDIKIREALLEENKVNHDNIFMLLSMIYDPQSVWLVKENLEADTTDSVTFAVEMMDIFCSDELKPKLLPVMDDMKDTDRLDKLLNHYAPDHYESYEDALKQIVNRDYNSLTRYTKALATYRLKEIEGVEVSYDLIANLFNPDSILLQTTADSIFKIDKAQYHTHTRRLKPSIKKELDKAVLPPVFIEEGEEYHQDLLLIDIILLLKEMKEFGHLPGQIITNIAESLEEIRLKKDTILIQNEDSGVEPLYIVVDGTVDIIHHGEVVRSVRKGEMIGEKLILETESFGFEAKTTEATSLLVLRKEELTSLMSRHVEIADSFVKIMNDDFEEKEIEHAEFDLEIFN